MYYKSWEKNYKRKQQHKQFKERGETMKDRHLGQIIIVTGCFLMLTQLVSPVMAVVFVLSGLSQL